MTRAAYDRQFTMLRDDEYYDLGGFGRPVTTTSDDAQTWFDRGLTWCYAFNHEEAVRCFQHAIEADPACAMAHWGLAYAIGPNYNKNWDAFEEQELTDAVATAHAAVTSASELASAGTPVERALIGALRARFPEHRPRTAPPGTTSTRPPCAPSTPTSATTRTWPRCSPRR